jgi:hypothetical protein
MKRGTGLGLGDLEENDGEINPLQCSKSSKPTSFCHPLPVVVTRRDLV